SPVGSDRILVQIPGLDTAKIQEARDQLSRVAKLEFALVHPQINELVKKIEAGEAIIPPDYRLVVYKYEVGENKKAEEKLLIHKKPDLTGDHITHAFATFQNEWQVSLELDSVGATRFDELAAAHFHERFAILLMGALTMFRFVLTLPGIAGIILTIGLAVDASVLIYERLREELALGKSMKVAVQTAYEKAFSSIFDANVTTLITAAILFWKASGPVKGFAIALTLGILASLFTALIVGRNFLGWFVDTGRLKRISMLHLISAQHINFLGKGFIACMCSLALLLAGAAAFYLRGE